MYLDFAWRYFRAKKSANAINIISWVTTAVIAFATCCQVLVLSVFNGFEGLVKSLYSSFYTDLKLTPAAGKTFVLDSTTRSMVSKQPFIQQLSMIAEETALLQNEDLQSMVRLKGVDEHFQQVSGVAGKITRGKYIIGDADHPAIIVGSGIQHAAGIILNEAFAPQNLTIILPKKNSQSNDPLQSLSEGNVTASGVFNIQQDFDNSYAITNIDFLKQQMGISENEFTATEIKLKPGADIEESKKTLQLLLGTNFKVQTRYEQNTNLYNTMKMEKWAIYAVLTLILIIAAFNMVSALTMLVLEKKQDIAILQSMGSSKDQVKKIFLTEGILLGGIGAITGISLAVIICLLQIKFKFIKLQGGSFLIDYFPVKLIATDFLLVASTAMAIALLASWFPATKAANQALELR
ncbi:MAG TPA: FtsX-like permease family protein [Ferruginibacter sp.]|nr:FtsX-like permease family protein [Ferruginibacter sp.]